MQRGLHRTPSEGGLSESYKRAYSLPCPMTLVGSFPLAQSGRPLVQVGADSLGAGPGPRDRKHALRCCTVMGRVARWGALLGERHPGGRLARGSVLQRADALDSLIGRVGCMPGAGMWRAPVLAAVEVSMEADIWHARVLRATGSASNPLVLSPVLHPLPPCTCAVHPSEQLGGV